MPRKNPRQFCIVCGGHESVVGGISTRGKCARCAAVRQLSNLHELRARSGPAFRQWRRAVAASVGGVLVDDLEAASRQGGE